MQSLVKKLKLKRVISILLLVCTVMSTFVTSFSNMGVVNAADSTDLRKTYIQMMSGRNTSQIEGLSDLNTNDLRVVALYLSNFYIPFTTTLDDVSEDDNLDTMIDAVKLMGVNDSVAKTLVSGVYSASLNSAAELYINVADLMALNSSNSMADDADTDNWYIGWAAKDGAFANNGHLGVITTTFKKKEYVEYVGDSYWGTDQLVKVGDEDDVDARQMYTPVTSLIWNQINRHLGKAGEAGQAKGSKGANIKQDIKLYYIDDSGVKHVAFSINRTTMLLLARFLRASTIADIGNAMNGGLGLSETDWGKSDGNTKAKMAFMFEKIYVDWVGNIFYDAGDRRIILYPACMNPYAWSGIQGNGTDSNMFNLVSTWGQYLINTNTKLEDKETAESDYSGELNWGSTTVEADNISDDNPYKSLESGTFNRSIRLYGTHYESEMKMFRGSGESFLWDTTDEIFNKGFGGDIQDWCKESGFAVGSEWWKNKLGGDGTIGYWGAMTGSDIITSATDFTHFITYNADLANKFGDGANLSVLDLTDPAHFGKYFTSTSKFASSSTDLGAFMSFGTADKMMLSNIFMTYAFAYANKDSTTFDKDKNYINIKFNESAFPKVDSSTLEWEVINSTADEVLGFTRLLLDPVEGVRYVATLIKNKLSGLFISWHEDVVGSTSSNVSTGMTRYLGFSGYATTPSLSDVEWCAKILEGYNSLIVYFIIFMCAMLLCYVLVGSLTLQRGLLGVVIFGVLAFLPPLAINTTVELTNKFSNQMYSVKFEYWAICQMEQYIGKLSNISTESVGNINDFYASLITANMSADNGKIDSATSFTGTKLKWMTPKKYNDLKNFQNTIDNSILTESGLSSNFTNTMINTVANASSTEDYTDCVGQTYLYRDMCDIYSYGAYSYNYYTNYSSSDDLLTKKFQIAPNKDSTVSEDKTTFKNSKYTLEGEFNNISKYGKYDLADYVTASIPKYAKSGGKKIPSVLKETSSLYAIDRGFLYDTVGLGDTSPDNANYFTIQTLATSYLVSYRETYETIHDNLTRLYDVLDEDKSFEMDLGYSREDLSKNIALVTDRVFGLTPDTFDFALKDIQYNTEDKNYTDLSGYYYSLYCESPYYFFNWNIRDQLENSGYGYTYNQDILNASHNSFKSLLLGDNQAYFFNIKDDAGDGYGELRDFMNFHDLFYYVIPALREGNDLVDTFDNAWGMFTYEDCGLTLNEAGKWLYNKQQFETISDFLNLKDVNDLDGDKDVDEYLWDAMNEEERFKFWHDYNVWTIFNSYVTWLDTMQDCDYAKSETISVMGDKFLVTDPLNPATYFSVDKNGNMNGGRYMVFSESEMKYYGLTPSDLTTVEQKIINIQSSVYESSIDLMNYYTLSDETLINAYSLLQIFEFNKEFSQESVVGGDYVLYPQGYELKAFTYDAYLRLIVAEASGESLMSDTNESIYERVAKNTSLFFGIFLLLNDLLAVYVVPMLKLFILILLFGTSILIIMGAAFKLEFNFLSVLWKSLLAPLLSFSVINIGLALIVSMFMSNGTQGVVQMSPTISLGDPTMALIVMLVINSLSTLFYFKTVKKCVADFVSYVKAVFNSMSSAVLGVANGMIKGVTSGKGKAVDGVASRVASTAKQRGKDNSPTSGKSGLGVAGALGAGALGGSLMNNTSGLDTRLLSDEQKDALTKSTQDEFDRRNIMQGMNKYDAKAYAGASQSLRKEEAKLAGLDARANAKDKDGNYILSDHKRTQLNKAKAKQQKSIDRAKRYADDIQNHGKFVAGIKKVGYKPRDWYVNGKGALGGARQGLTNTHNRLTTITGGIGSAIEKGKTSLGQVGIRKTAKRAVGGTFKKGTSMAGAYFANSRKEGKEYYNSRRTAANRVEMANKAQAIRDRRAEKKKNSK